jgi:transcriptional regulator with XRE-family HTH domain
MPEGKVGRPRRNTERAKRVGERIRDRLKELGKTQIQFADNLGVAQPAVSAWISGKHDAASSPIAGKIAKTLIWTRDELVDGPVVTTRFDGSRHLVIKWRLAQALSNIVGEPLLDLPEDAMLLHLDQSCLRGVVAACAEALSEVRHLKSGHEMIGIMPVLETMIVLAGIPCFPPIEGSRQLKFDATDQLVHCASFVFSVSKLEAFATRHLDGMAAIILEDSGADLELLQRYRVRRADVLKILGRNAQAFRILRNVFDHAEEHGSTHTLTYPAFRTSCVLAARNEAGEDEFEKFLKRGRAAIESGYLPPHDVSHVREGIADARATRFQKLQRKTIHSLQREYALEEYEAAVREAADAEKYAGGKHVEFSLRLGMLPISFADAGILDLVSVIGISPEAQRQQLAENLREVAVASGNERFARRLA